MHSGVGREFWMEGRRHDVAFLHQRRLVGEFGEDFDTLANALENRSADENHFEWFVVESCFAGHDIAVDLAAVAVAEDRHIEQAERILLWIFHVGGEEDCAGAGAEDRAIIRREFADGFVETFFAQELKLCSAFTAGEDETVAAFQVGGGADLDGFSAEIGEHLGVRSKITLYRKDSDFQSRLRVDGKTLTDRHKPNKENRSVGNPIDRGKLGRSSARPYMILPSPHYARSHRQFRDLAEVAAPWRIGYQPRV